MTSKAEQLCHGLLRHLDTGELVVRGADGTERTYGKPGSLPRACVVVHDASFYDRILREGDVGLGESYSEGLWDEQSGDLVSLIGIFLQSDLRAKVGKNVALSTTAAVRFLRTLPTRTRSRDNVEFHYDLGNDFFETFLDPTMTYSCGYQRSTDDTLQQMQFNKYEIICRKLDLGRGDRLLDIGSGWGGMLIHAAQHHGARGLGVTLSAEQAEWSRRRIADLGLDGQLEVRLCDYRDVAGRFDKVVSIGMFEHVGRAYYSAFMRKVTGVLPPGGLALVHTIGTTGGVYPSAWLRKNIFPGVALPRIADLTEPAREAGGTVIHLENWRMHYAETTRHWKEQFHANEQRAQLPGHLQREQFLRTWDFYLQLLEANFRFGPLQLYQVLFMKGNRWSGPMNLDFHVDERTTYARGEA
jgi:cyclopropane-fatty-acyl-phospholipid synthase